MAALVCRSKPTMDSWEDIDLEGLNCQLCNENNKMVRLGCKHNVCEECLKNIKKQSVRNRRADAFSCPYCRAPIQRDAVKAGW